MPSVDPAEELLRRVFAFCIKPDNTVSSSAFKTKGRPAENCSVYRRSLKAPEEVIATKEHQHFSVAGFLASSVTVVSDELVAETGAGALTLTCGDDPTDDAHCSIAGLTKVACKRLADKAYPVLVTKVVPRSDDAESPG